MEYPYLNLEYLFLRAYRLFSGEDTILQSRDIILAWDIVRSVGIVLILLMVTGIVYLYIRIGQIRQMEREEYLAAAKLDTAGTPVALRADHRWEKILEHVNSDNENDQRQAIIEADLLLEEIVTRAGYQGETLGEKLRTAEKSDFHTLDDAWQAHKIRNRIAHEGSSFQISKREALQTIDRYRRVFEEFFYL